MIDASFQRAVNGELQGIVIITVDMKGEFQVNFHGIRIGEAIGSLQLSLNALISQTLRSMQ